jgi:hypothetical protein
VGGALPWEKPCPPKNNNMMMANYSINLMTLWIRLLRDLTKRNNTMGKSYEEVRSNLELLRLKRGNGNKSPEELELEIILANTPQTMAEGLYPSITKMLRDREKPIPKDDDIDNYMPLSTLLYPTMFNKKGN